MKNVIAQNSSAARPDLKLTSINKNVDFLLRQAQKLANVGFWTFDKNTEAVEWSDEMYDIMAVSKTFNPSNHLSGLTLMDKPDREQIVHAAQLVLEKGIPFDHIIRIKTPLKYRKWVRTVGYPILEGQRITGIMGLGFDVTRAQESAELLRACEGNFSKAFMKNPDAMMLVREEDFVIVDINSKVSPLLGYRREELLGKRGPDLKLFVNDDERTFLLNTYMPFGEAELECEWKRKNKAVISVRLHLSRIVVNCQKYMMVFIEDNTPVHFLHRTGPDSMVQPSTKRSKALGKTPKAETDANFKLAIPTVDGLIFIRATEIIYCAAESNYTRFHVLGTQKFLASKSLKEFEQVLSTSQFFRAHNSYLINLNHVKRFNKSDNTITMESGAIVPIARSKKNQFLEVIGRKERVRNG